MERMAKATSWLDSRISWTVHRKRDRRVGRFALVMVGDRERPGLSLGSMSADTHDPAHPVILFDGVCNLCNRSVQFIIDRDRKGKFRFAAIQSEAGARLLAERGHVAITGEPDSVMLIDGATLSTHSDAALRIARRLDGAWPLLGALLIVPRVIRDAAYRVIARNRYRWFGRSETCRVPTPELRARFLE